MISLHDDHNGSNSGIRYLQNRRRNLGERGGFILFTGLLLAISLLAEDGQRFTPCGASFVGDLSNDFPLYAGADRIGSLNPDFQVVINHGPNPYAVSDHLDAICNSSAPDRKPILTLACGGPNRMAISDAQMIAQSRPGRLVVGIEPGFSGGVDATGGKFGFTTAARSHNFCQTAYSVYPSTALRAYYTIPAERFGEMVTIRGYLSDPDITFHPDTFNIEANSLVVIDTRSDPSAYRTSGSLSRCSQRLSSMMTRCRSTLRTQTTNIRTSLYQPGGAERMANNGLVVLAIAGTILEGIDDMREGIEDEGGFCNWWNLKAVEIMLPGREDLYEQVRSGNRSVRDAENLQRAHEFLDY